MLTKSQEKGSQDRKFLNAKVVEGSRLSLDSSISAGLISQIEKQSFVGRKAALLLFASTDCPACAMEIAFWNETASKFGKQIVFQSFFLSDSQSVRHFVRDNRVAFPAIPDRNGDLVFKRNQITFVPTAILVDRDLRVQKKWTGILADIEKNEIGDFLVNR
jgi:peroxiredoxin